MQQTHRRSILIVLSMLGISKGRAQQTRQEPTNDPKALEKSIAELRIAFETFKDTQTAIAENVSSLSITHPPIGTIIAYAGTKTPEGWLPCDGMTYDGTVAPFKALVDVISLSFGGSQSNFKVPNLQGRVAMGAGNGDQLTPRNVGQYFGNETHKLKGDELPSHTHAPHHHVWLFSGGGSNFARGAEYNTAVRGANGVLLGIPEVGPRPNQTGGYITSDEGSTGVAGAGEGQAFDVLPPTCVVKYLIRYK